MIHDGFQRLVLLGSAGYQRAELPLDDAVSLIAPNNTGKTSLINALQFLLIIDKRRMDFGAHDPDKSRRFYFPTNSAYILLEVSLPKSGTVVLGCVGKGVSHDYEYFAYKGPLHIEEFRLANDKLVTQPNLQSHLAEHGRLVYRYTPAEFRDLIYGGRRTKASGDPDLTVFQLENAGDAQAFQQVLTRTLRLDKLSSANVKEYLLQIFKRDLPDANIDFKQEWDKAFAEVNSERAQYLAAKNQLTFIQQLENNYQERLALRGKLIVWRPKIDAGLEAWQAYFEKQTQALTDQKNVANEESKRLTEEDRKITLQKDEAERKRDELRALKDRQSVLAQKFALILSRAPLEQQLAFAKSEAEEQITLMGQAQSRQPAAIQRDIQSKKAELKNLQSELNNLDDNLYQQLKASLPAEYLAQLNRLFNRQVMGATADRYVLDVHALQVFLSEFDTSQIALPGLKLSLHEFDVQFTERTAQELQEQIEDTNSSLLSFNQQLETANAWEAAQSKKRELERAVKVVENEITLYDELQGLAADSLARDEAIEQFNAEIDHCKTMLDEMVLLAEQYRQRMIEIDGQLRRLKESHASIDQNRNKRLDGSDAFHYLYQLEHTPWLAEPEWPLEKLPENLKAYRFDCSRLLDFNRSLSTGLNELHSHGLTKYQYSDTQDRELKSIIEFSQHLPQEQAALEKKARSAVVNVTASLKELRSGLYSFQTRMKEFNRLIGNRQLSDLKTFKIEAATEERLVDAIDILISTAEQVDTGDSFELFNQTSVLDDEKIDRAKQILIDEGNARRGLKVSDLFRLLFVVGKVDQAPESFEDIDSAASNGTVLMAKLVTGLAMLYLMQDQRHQVRGICYLDEALALDGRNQSSLIETAREFGFALIFASPSPLTTVRYCVPIHHHNGKNHISRDSWHILEPLGESL